jgi:hypothetical protein
LREKEGPSPQGWEGEGLLGIEGAQDSLDHAIGIGENVVVPEPEEFPSVALEASRSALVCRTVRVLTAIDFDHQLVLGAGEVDYEVADRVLPAEFVTRQPAISQSGPHSPFGIRRGLS